MLAGYKPRMNRHLLAIVFALGFWTAIAQGPKNRVALLNDGSLLEGTIEVFEQVVRITPAVGTARILPLQQIAFVGDSRESAYDFVAAKVDPATIDGAQQLAAWCEKVGMFDKALIHARSVLAKSPDDASAKAAVARIEKAAATKPAPLPQSRPATTVTPAMLELASGAATSFATKVQPILSNLCVSCHSARDYSGPFKLHRMTEGYANPEVVAANLSITKTQLNREKPAESPLLKYALAAHGGQKRPAFVNREAAAYQNLEAWVLAALPKPTQTVSFGARMPSGATPSVPMTPAVPALAGDLPGEIVGAIRQPLAAKNASPVPQTSPTPPAPPTQPIKPIEPQSVLSTQPQVPLATPAPQRPITNRDPFDPELFNRLPKKNEK